MPRPRTVVGPGGRIGPVGLMVAHADRVDGARGVLRRHPRELVPRLQEPVVLRGRSRLEYVRHPSAWHER